MRVWAVRHGESEYNLLRLCNDDPAQPVHLTARGRAQAAAAAERLAVSPVDAVYASPLPRARETAAIIAARIGAAVTVDARLADIRSGCEGRPVAEYQAAIAHDPLHARPNGSESLLDHRDRVAGFLAWLKEQSHAGVILVCHEETLRVLRSEAEDIPPADAVDLAFANGEIYAFAT
ncbi:MAG: histidine phosphatase family protein [Gammaproteobacteria bacterium]|jgi:broad specificity phosphatase PhoE|nr:histidine phosphatase family protein [Gammaproteobacteria bacterium]